MLTGGGLYLIIADIRALRGDNMQNQTDISEKDNIFDLLITKIENVHFSSTDSWARPNPFPRPSDGIVLFTGGSITYDFGGEKITAKAGDILIFPKGLVYSGQKKAGTKNSFYVVDFYTDAAAPFSAIPLPKVYTPKHYDLLVPQFDELLKLWQSGELNGKIALKGKLYSFIADIVQQYMQSSLGAECFTKARKIADYIETRFNKSDLCVSDICKEFFISTSTLRRIMLSAYHKTPIKYITEVRIKNAKNMLAYDNISVNEIAEKCGFASTHYFSRIFKKEVGISPLEYKNSK